MVTDGERLARLETRVDTLEKTFGQMSSDVREIRDAVVSAKGGWKTMSLIGVSCGGLGAFLQSLLAWFPVHR